MSTPLTVLEVRRLSSRFTMGYPVQIALRYLG